MKQKSIFLIGAILFLGLNSFAQSSTNTSGGNVSGTGGNVSYTVGEVFYTNYSGSTGSVSAGVQHTYKVDPNGIFDKQSFSVNLLVSPNPTSDFINLNIENFKQEPLVYQLVDLQGKLIETMDINIAQTRINMSNLASATYILNITLNTQTVQSFKIIKN